MARVTPAMLTACPTAMTWPGMAPSVPQNWPAMQDCCLTKKKTNVKCIKIYIISEGANVCF